MPRKRKRGRTRPFPRPVPGELFGLLGPLGFTELQCQQMEDQAAAAADRGETYRSIHVSWGVA